MRKPGAEHKWRIGAYREEVADEPGLGRISEEFREWLLWGDAADKNWFPASWGWVRLKIREEIKGDWRSLCKVEKNCCKGPASGIDTPNATRMRQRIPKGVEVKME